MLDSMYGMTNSGKFFANDLTEWLIKAGFIQSQCHMYIYYKYAPYGYIIIVISYVDDCVNNRSDISSLIHKNGI